MLDKAWRLVAFKKGRRMPEGRLASSRPPRVVGSTSTLDLVNTNNYPDRGVTFIDMGLRLDTDQPMDVFIEKLADITDA